MTIDPIFQVALTSALKSAIDKDARDQVGPGVHKDVEMTLTIKAGEVRIGQDTDKAPTVSIPLKAAMALLIKRMGFQREKAVETLRDVMQEALRLDKDAEKTILAEQGVADAEKMLKEEVLAKLPRTPVKGAVKVKDVTLTLHSASIAEA